MSDFETVSAGIMSDIERLRQERDALVEYVGRLEGEINRTPNIDGVCGQGCRCQICGILYIGDLVVPDDVWEVIKPAGKAPGAGIMCANCIMSRISFRGLWSAGHAFDCAVVGGR